MANIEVFVKDKRESERVMASGVVLHVSNTFGRGSDRCLTLTLDTGYVVSLYTSCVAMAELLETFP